MTDEERIARYQQLCDEATGLENRLDEIEKELVELEWHLPDWFEPYDRRENNSPGQATKLKKESPENRDDAD